MAEDGRSLHLALGVRDREVLGWEWAGGQAFLFPLLLPSFQRLDSSSISLFSSPPFCIREGVTKVKGVGEAQEANDCLSPQSQGRAGKMDMQPWRPKEDKLWAPSGRRGVAGAGRPRKLRRGDHFLVVLTISIPPKASWGRERTGAVWEGRRKRDFK